jgi:hypothetical protein
VIDVRAMRTKLRMTQEELPQATGTTSNVTVFCSGDKFRNDLGRWATRCVAVPKV